MSLKYTLLLAPSLLLGSTPTDAATLEAAIVGANSGADTSISIQNDISDFTQNLRPLGCDATFSLVDGRSMTIEGNSNTLDFGNSYRGFIAAGEPTGAQTGTLTIQNLVLSNASAIGGTTGSGGGGGGAGLGGGLFVGKNTTVELVNVSFDSCSAIGGDAFSFNGTTGGAGGMTGLGARNPYGGGGGFYANGAQGSSTTAGGGGGCGTNAVSTFGGGDFDGTTGGATGAGGNGNSSGNGADGTYGGGGGAGRGANGGAGGWGGGGGGGGVNGGNGGFGGGGGGGGQNGIGGDGGFGGGGGGGFLNTIPGSGGFGGGDGATTYGGGGGAMGGAIFIEDGGTLEIVSVSFTGSSLTPGESGNNSEPASTYGTDIFLMSGGNLTFNNTSDLSLTNPIEGDEGAGGGSGGTLLVNGGNKVTLPASCTYDGTVNIANGTLSVSADSCLGASSTGLTIDGTATLEVTSSFTSARDIDTGTTGGAISVATDETLTLSGAISASGDLTKSGAGTLTLTGDSSGYTGTGTVSAGTMVVNGTFGDLSVGSSGTLKGNGTTGSLTLTGTLAPGNSIDTINIDGDYVQEADGLLQIEINPTENDKVVVTGSATLAGTLEILPLAGSYTEGTTYTIIEAASINGTFDTVTEDDPLEFTVTYGATTVTLTIPLPQLLTVVPLSALSGNELAVANYIFCSNFSTQDPDMVAMRSALGSLSSGPYQTALLNLTPVQYIAYPIATSTVFSALQENLTTPLRTCYKRGSHFTIAPLYVHNKFDPTGQQYPFHSNTGGAIAEYGYTYGNGFQADARMSYSYTRIEWEKGVGRGRIDTVSVGPRLGYSSPTTSLSFSPSYMLTTNAIDRDITIGTINRTATGDFLANGLGAHFDIFHKEILGTNENHTTYIAPQASVDVLALWQNRCKEEGASSLDLHVKGKTYGTLMPKAGMLLGSTYPMLHGLTFSPSLGIGYSGYIPLNTGTLYASMPSVQGCGRSFQTSAYDTALNRWEISVKADFTRCNMKFLTVGYDIQTNKRLTTQNVQAQLQWSF